VLEFVAQAKVQPGKLNFASAGNGSAAHMAGETLNDLARIELLHVPYKGGAPALNDLMGGHVASYFGNTASTLGHVKAGKVRALAVGSSRRLAALPDVPTLQEAGLAGFVTQEWNGLFVPKGTPEEVVQRLAREVKAALAEPEVNQRLVQLGLEVVGSTPAEFGAFVQAEMRRAVDVVKARGIKLD
jgi:tripartite-type tricarboxylate transporter receptor subunit TctC